MKKKYIYKHTFLYLILANSLFLNLTFGSNIPVEKPDINSGVSEVMACPFTVDSSHTNVSCYFSFDGMISITVSNGTEPYEYDWSDDAYDDQNNLFGLGGGDYSVTITDADGCMDTLNFSVLEPEPFIPECSDVVFPTGPQATNGELNFTLTGGVPPFRIEWLLQDGTILGDSIIMNRELFIDGLPAAEVIVRVTDDDGCVTTCTASLLMGECDFEMVADVTQNECISENNGRIELIPISAEEPISYNWDRNEFDGMSVLNNLEGGEYSVSVVDAFGCDTLINISIDSGYIWEVNCNLINEQTDASSPDGELNVEILNGRFPLEVEVSGSIDSVFTLDEGSTVLMFRNLRGGIYNFSVTDSTGCTLECSTEVPLELPRPRFFIPNAFTPNSDGTNDRLNLYTNETIVEIIHFRIFNRWGEKVYELSNVLSNGTVEAWDGIYKSDDALPGVYPYSVSFRTATGELISLTGDITLIR